MKFVEKKNKELYKNAADVPDDDFFTNDEVKEEANTESQKEDKKTIPRGPRAFVDTVVFGTERMPCVFCDPCV